MKEVKAGTKTRYNSVSSYLYKTCFALPLVIGLSASSLEAQATCANEWSCRPDNKLLEMSVGATADVGLRQFIKSDGGRGPLHDWGVLYRPAMIMGASIIQRQIDKDYREGSVLDRTMGAIAAELVVIAYHNIFRGSKKQQ